MSNLLLSLFFIFLVFLIGYYVAKMIVGKGFNFAENIGASFGVGLTLNYFNLLILSLLGIQINAFLILLGFLIWLGIAYFNLRGRSLSEKQRWRKINFSFLHFLLILLLLVCFGSLFFKTISVGFDAWDELAYWGKAARMVYVHKSIIIQEYLVPESSGFPTLWPVSGGSVAIFAGGFVENYLKLLTPLAFSSLAIYFYGYLKRLSLDLNERLAFVLILVTGSPHLFYYASNFYADVFFIYLFTIGTTLLLRLSDEKKESGLKWLTSFFLIALVLAKRGGSILALISIFSIFLFSVRDLFKRKKAIVFVVPLASIFLSQIGWSKFSLAMGQSTSTYANIPFENFKFGISNLPYMLNMGYIKLMNRWNYPFFWSVTGYSLLLGSIIFRKKIYFTIALIVILNLAYLLTAYLILFSKNEVLMLASFERYVLSLIPICLLGIAHFYKDLRDIIRLRENKNSNLIS